MLLETTKLEIVRFQIFFRFNAHNRENNKFIYLTNVQKINVNNILTVERKLLIFVVDKAFTLIRIP